MPATIPEHENDPTTALWRTVPAPRPRSALARVYREQLGEDWRDYYTGPYEDDGPNEHEDA